MDALARLSRRLFGSGIVYRCGNCQSTFKTEEALDAHRTPDCPIVAIERQLSEWYARVMREVAES